MVIGIVLRLMLLIMRIFRGRGIIIRLRIWMRYVCLFVVLLPLWDMVGRRDDFFGTALHSMTRSPASGEEFLTGELGQSTGECTTERYNYSGSLSPLDEEVGTQEAQGL